MIKQRFFKTGAIRLLVAGLVLSAGVGTASGADVKTLSFSRAQMTVRPDPLVAGICVHFGIGGEYNYVPETAATLIQDLGFDSFRDDLPWPSFDSPLARADGPRPRRLFEFMKLTKATPLLILGHSNPAVPGGVKPLTDPAGRAAYTDFAVRAAAATKAFNPTFEIWNEWNLTPGLRPPWLIGPGAAGDPRAAEHYAALARATIPALRAAEPGIRILSGVTGGDPDWSWTKAVVRDGALKDANGLSVHLYNHCEPDVNTRNATELADRVSSLQTALKGQTGAEVPIYITEFGWPTARRPCVISRQAAADYSAQFLLWSAATPWLKGAWIYQLKDQGRNPDEIEDNFGLYDYDFRPKPAACAVREAVRLIKSSGGFRLERPFPDLFVLHATTSSGIRLIAWTTRADIKGELRFEGGAPRRATALCNLMGPMPEGRVRIGPEPIIIDVDAGAVRVGAALLP
ncbi:UNVERIFIED_ORG: hypothetical protein ABID33_004528 [Xanthobacter viscosus]|uniref:Asl1-like glycosyl hydrolase catalytic domain-containing protein n=1 Tax=Xanthobacter autotrophicus TaxID=280 RepID=A0A6C1KHW5_XANAU|nr:hypothetical protein [Xanthobacter autotrophicus]TLX43401.1 hypothetical protein FBQ73_08595 [Xanthobacter autotrophicus]